MKNFKKLKFYVKQWLDFTNGKNCVVNLNKAGNKDSLKHNLSDNIDQAVNEYGKAGHNFL